MLNIIKHITDDNFFLSGGQCTGALCVTQSNWVNMWFSCFPVFPGSAEIQIIWGGIVKRLLIAYFIGKISTKKCQNPFMCVKVIASQRWDVFFETRCIYIFGGSCPLTEFCQLQNSLCIQVFRSSVLAALLHGTRAVGISHSLRHGTRNQITELLQRAPPIFEGRPSRCSSAHILVLNVVYCSAY